MKYLVIIAFALVACEEANLPPAGKAECKDLLEHIVKISPQSQGQDPAKVVAALPFEDFQSCIATEPEIRACMLRAPDVAGVKTCVLEVPDCMRKADAAKAEVHEKKKDVDPAIDKRFDDIRFKCWNGDPKAADSLKTT